MENACPAMVRNMHPLSRDFLNANLSEHSQ